MLLVTSVGNTMKMAVNNTAYITVPIYTWGRSFKKCSYEVVARLIMHYHTAHALCFYFYHVPSPHVTQAPTDLVCNTHFISIYIQNIHTSIACSYFIPCASFPVYLSIFLYWPSALLKLISLNTFWIQYTIPYCTS